MKPKTLSLREMWELYKLIGTGFKKEYLLEEVSEMLEKVSRPNLRKAIKMLYKDNPISNPMDVIVLFIKGLKHNKFFEFQSLVESLHGRG